MSDLVTWLRAQLDADERSARRADSSGCRWSAVTDADVGPGVRTELGKEVQWQRDIPYAVWHCEDEQDGCPEAARGCIAEAEHIARHDPARVLRQVAAMRKIVDMCLAGIDPQAPVTPGVRAGYRAILTDLAAIYADRDGYGEWRL